MPLAPGARLGAYEILSTLGVGGMGEVYRARDPRLNREVAIKILPEAAARDPDRRERFQREAQAVAALNHPNIVTIYSVEADAGTAFLTMELVDGRPLSDVLPKKGFPLPTLLSIGIQVADAVAAAHQKGITHRDLKPANIMLGGGEQPTRVKVLDFGLAKLESEVSRDGSDMPTALLTGEGRILGTVAYMSPEQAEGKPIDARSDLFSVGVVLYEMATGRRPFTGDTSVSIVSSIVKDTPASVTSLNPTLPRELGRIIRRALAKDPEARYQTAKDLRNDLKDLRASLESGELALDAVAVPAGARGRSARTWQAVAIVAVLAALVASVLLVRRNATTPVPTAVATPIEVTRITSGVTAGRPAISPDAKFVAYVQTTPDNQNSVWVRQLATGSNVQIVAAESGVGIFGLTITPDGAFVDLLRSKIGEAWALWRVPLLGGPARKIVDGAATAPGWSPDGKQMAVITQTALGTERSLAIADADGTHLRVIATRKLPLRYVTTRLGGRPNIHPVWLPDGRSIVVVGTDERKAFAPELLKIDTATGSETQEHAPAAFGEAGFDLALAADGDSVLMNVPAERGGPPQVARVRLADGAITWLTTSLDAYDGLSRGGDRVVSTRTEARARLWVGNAAANGLQPVGLEATTDGDSSIAWAGPNRVIYTAALAGGTGAWATDVASGASQLLLPRIRTLAVTSDGRTILYEDENGIWRADADGTHASRLSNPTRGLQAIAPDGSALFCLSGQSGLQTAWKTDLHGRAPHQFVDRRVNGSGMAVSPDGRWVALTVTAEDANRLETIVVSVDGGPPVHRLAPIATRGIAWTPDGKALASVDRTGTNIVLYPVDGGPSRALTHFIDQTIFGFAWSPDGRRLVLWRGTRTSDIVLLKGVR